MRPNLSKRACSATLQVNNIKGRKKKRNRGRKHSSKHKTASTSLNLNLNRTMWDQSMQSALTWQYKHQLALWKAKALSLDYENKVLHKMLQKQMELKTTQPSEDSSSAVCEDSESSSGEDSHEEYSDDDNAERVEVSNNFMDFLMINVKHKEELEKERAAIKKEEGEEDRLKEMELPPTKPLHLEREKDMKLLYGADSKRIACMEAAMQLDFDNFSDKFKPALWPNIPLKL